MSETARTSLLSPHDLLRTISAHGIRCFTGVPDSVLKDFCVLLAEEPVGHHTICVNEGSAVAIAAGHHLATGALPLVYMQNSGLGNAMNPLATLCATSVYSIPMVLLIGWRGKPGESDEPQHRFQGSQTEGILERLEIPFVVLTAETMERAVAATVEAARRRSSPAALLVPPGTFASCKPKLASPHPAPSLAIEDAIAMIAAAVKPPAITVSSTGYISRLLLQHRIEQNEPQDLDFLVVGSMGHASGLALGIAANAAKRRVYCLDGDGALLMHMGAMTTIGRSNARGLCHLVLNNGCHDSVGGQSTGAFDIDLIAIATACGYRNVARADTVADLERFLGSPPSLDGGPSFLEIRVARTVPRTNLVRPADPLTRRKDALMSLLSSAALD